MQPVPFHDGIVPRDTEDSMRALWLRSALLRRSFPYYNYDLIGLDGTEKSIRTGKILHMLLPVYCSTRDLSSRVP